MIETVTPKLGLSSKWRIFPLSNDNILEDSSDFVYPMAQMQQSRRVPLRIW